MELFKYYTVIPTEDILSINGWKQRSYYKYSNYNSVYSYLNDRRDGISFGFTNGKILKNI